MDEQSYNNIYNLILKVDINDVIEKLNELQKSELENILKELLNEIKNIIRLVKIKFRIIYIYY